MGALQRSGRWVAFLCLLLCFNTATAADLVASGKAAFQRGQFDVALRHFRARRKLGDTSAVLTYNIAVALYRLGDLNSARKEFTALVGHSKLGRVARYNLGLIAMTLGDQHTARDAFSQVATGPAADKLARLARLALRDLADTARKPTHDFHHVVTGFAGFGYDSNVYRTPSNDYIDYARRSAPFTDPIRHAAYFVPVTLRAQLHYTPISEVDWLAEYRFRGRIYPDADIDNANRYQHRLQIGRAAVLDRNSERTHSLYLGAILRLEFRNDVDRDDGLDREFSGIDISDRVSFFSDGFEARYRVDAGALRLQLRGSVERRNYEEFTSIDDFDHMLYRARADVRYRITRRDRVSLKLETTKRDYSNRHSRDESGSLNAFNPLREFLDNELEASWRHRFSGSWRAIVSYRAFDRTDEFVGYDDYLEHRLRLRIYARLAKKTKLRFDGSYRARSYPLAFAFNTPGQKDKAKDVVAISAEAEHELSAQLSVFGAISYRDERTPDRRFRYDRTLTTIGLRWRF